MLITKDVEITINNNTATVNEPIYIYQNDRNIDLCFKIVDPKFRFQGYEGNILVESTAQYSTIKVLKPNGERFITDKLKIVDNKVVLTITQDFTDEIGEIGEHKMQIQLWDGNNGRVTIPPISFTVLAPIFEDDGEIKTLGIDNQKEVD